VARKLPETTVVKAGGVSLYVLHNLNDLDPDPLPPVFKQSSLGIRTSQVSKPGGSAFC
jgi:hypothetical protein